jgi:hypothetical protein
LPLVTGPEEGIACTRALTSIEAKGAFAAASDLTHSFKFAGET